MLKKDIVVGGFYLAKVNNKIVTVKVDRIQQATRPAGYTGKITMPFVYHVTNLATGRQTTFRSAAKFRCPCDAQGNVAMPATKRKQLQNTVADYDALPAPTEAQTQQAEAAYDELTTAAIAEAEVAQEQAPFAQTITSAQPMQPQSSSGDTANHCQQESTPTSSPVVAAAGSVAADPLGIGGPITSLGAVLTSAAKRKHPPTPEQQAILDAVAKLGRGDVLVVQAGAGAGKTSTQVMIEEVLPGRGQYTAFNKSLVKESSHKFRRAACNTTHSLAFRAIGKRYAKRLDGERVRSRDVARMLGIEDFTVPMPTPDNPDNFRILEAGFLAGQVTQAVKRFCQSADQQIGESHIKYIDGLDMPEDGRRTYANNNRLRQYLLPYCQKAWADLSDPDGKLPFSHDVYVKVWQLEKPVISADYIMVDECFPAGTLVGTSEGIWPIEFLAENRRPWRILAYLGQGRIGYTKVVAAYATPRKGPLVRIRHERGELCCTANHPIQVQGRGWVQAGLVSEGDSLSCLREPDEDGVQNLLDEVRGTLEGGKQRPNSRSGETGQDICSYEAGQEGNPQPSEQARDQGEDISYAQGPWDHVHGAWWQRQGTNEVRAVAAQGALPTAAQLVLEPRVCRVAWKEAKGLSNELQARHRFPGDDGGDRSGRRLPSRQEGPRQEEAGSLGGTRVASVEVYEPADHSLSVDDGANGDCVYTLQTEAGNYIANGVLVKNCQDTAEVMVDILRQQSAPLILVGDSAQSIYEWRGAVNAMAAFPQAKELTLSQSFRFGQAIADVANQILAEIPGITLRLRGFDQVPSTVGPVAKPTCILTRTNAAAIGAVLQAMADGERPHLIGGGSDVVAFVEAALALQAGKPTGHPELACFGSWAEVQEYVKQDEGEDLKLMVKLIDSFGAETILNALKRMPTEDRATLVVCTAHKSKGREWDTVKLAHDFPTLSKASEPDLKLIYVAATRAKLRLDVTECPFFTGEDALELLPSPEGFVLPEAPAVAPPTPSQAPPDKFTWAKDRDGKWRVRGPAGQEGQKVQVFQRNGSSEWKTLTKVAGRSSDAYLYESTR